MKQARLIGFDVIRLVSFFIISFYHYLYAVWRERVPDFNATMVHEPVFWNFMYPALRSLSFSGHTIMFMSAMLIALARKSFSQILRLAAFLFLAWMAFCAVEKDFQQFTVFWDVHALLLVGLVSIALVEKLEHRQVITIGVLGVLLTLIPFWQMGIFQFIPMELRAPLVGDCDAESSSWPLLPWIGFLWAGYALGVYLREPTARARVSTIGKKESITWGIALLASITRWGAFYKLDALDDWECHAFRLGALDFWAHFIWVLFAIRISLLTSANEWLARKIPWLQKFHVSKNFFLAYALQYVFAFLIVLATGGLLRTHPLAFTLVGFMMLPLAEGVARLGALLGARTVFKGRSP